MKKATPAQLRARKNFTDMVRARAAAKKKAGKYLGALPVGFRGALYGWQFTIKGQYRIDGITAAQIWDNDGVVVEITGTNKNEIKQAVQIIKSNIVAFRPEIMEPGKYQEKERKDIFKRVELLVKDIYREAEILNKGIRSTTKTKTPRPASASTRRPAPATVRKTAAKKKPAATRTKTTRPASAKVRKTAATYVKNIQRGSSATEYDKMKKALPPGKRLSENGRTYYEYRRNRTDAPGQLTGHDGISLNDISNELYALEYKINQVKAKKRTAKLIKEKKEFAAELTILNKQFKTLREYLNSRAKFV